MIYPRKRLLGACLISPAAYSAIFILIMLDSDGSGTALAAGGVAQLLLGGGCAAMRLNLVETLGVTLWWPAVMAQTDLYWKLGMNSPHGAAAELFKFILGAQLPGKPAYIVLLAVLGAAAWAYAQFEFWYKKRNGRYFLFHEE